MPRVRPNCNAAIAVYWPWSGQHIERVNVPLSGRLVERVRVSLGGLCKTVVWFCIDADAMILASVAQYRVMSTGELRLTSSSQHRAKIKDIQPEGGTRWWVSSGDNLTPGMYVTATQSARLDRSGRKIRD